MTFRTVSGKVACNPVPARTNLVPNPSFRGTSGTVEVRRNLIPNPSFENGATGWTPVRATTSIVPVTGGPAGPNALRLTVTDISSASYLAAQPVGTAAYPFAANSAVTVGCSVLSPVTRIYVVQVYEYDSAGTLLTPVQPQTNVTCNAGVWTRVEQTWTTKPTTAYVRPILALGTASAVGDYWDIDAAYCGVPGPFFDGSTAAADGLIYSWTGTANNSAAIATGKALAGWANVAAGVKGWQGADGVSQRMLLTKDLAAQSPSLAYTPQGFPISADVRIGSGQFTVFADRAVTLRTSVLSYTGGSAVDFRSADTAVSTSPVTIKAQGSVPLASADTWKLALYPVGAFVAGTNITVTQAAFEAAPTVGTFFDGNTAQTDTNAYLWSGVANASTSEELVKRKPSLLSIDGVTWRTLTEVAKRVNYYPNPSARSSTVVHEIRRNLHATLANLGSGNTVDGLVTYAGKQWQQVTVVTANTGARSMVNLASLVNSATYTISVEFANPDAVSRTVSTDWCDGANASAVLAPGETRRISATGTRALGYDATYRFADFTTTTVGTLLMREILIERADAALPYFDGDTPASEGLTCSWVGAANASQSVMNANRADGWGTNTGPELGMFYQYPSGREDAYSCALYPKKAQSMGLHHFNAVPQPTASPGEVWTISGYIYAPTAVNLYAMLRWRSNPNQGPSVLDSQSTQFAIPAGAWTRVSYTSTAPAGTGALMAQFTFVNPVQGVIYRVDDALLEKVGTLGNYFDGSSAPTLDHTYSWSGAADVITSVSYANP